MKIFLIFVINATFPLFYAALILLNKRITGVSAIEKTLVQLVSAGVVMSIYAFVAHEGSWVLPQGFGLVALLVVGFVHTGIAYLLYISSMQELPGQNSCTVQLYRPSICIDFLRCLFTRTAEPDSDFGRSLYFRRLCIW